MKTALFAIAIPIAMLLTGCSKQPNPAYSTPEKALEALGNVMMEKSYSDYLDLLSKELLTKTIPQQYEAAVSIWSGEYEIIKREEIDTTHINLHAKFYYDGHSRFFEKSTKGYKVAVFHFVLEEGEWKLDKTTFTKEKTTG